MDDAGLLGRMMALAGRIAREQGSVDGFRTIVNTGRILSRSWQEAWAQP